MFSSSQPSEDLKGENEDAVSGPVLCAGNLTVPETLHEKIQNNLTLRGNNTHEGIVLLNDGDGEKPICDDGWDIEGAHVACRQLGFMRALQATWANQAGTDAFALDQVKCRGNETSLMDCEHLEPPRKENCNSGEAAGVVCDPKTREILQREADQKTEECFARNVLFGPELSSDVWVLDWVLDCQKMCGETEGCNTFSYDSISKECRLHSVGEVEEPEYPQPSTTTPLPSIPPTPAYRAIRVGERVRVCSNVQNPEYGWGSVSHTSIGTVREVLPGGDYFAIYIPVLPYQ